MWNIEDFVTCEYRLRKTGYCKWEVEYKRFLIWINAGYWYGSRDRALNAIKTHKQFGSFDPEEQWEKIN